MKTITNIILGIALYLLLFLLIQSMGNAQTLSNTNPITGEVTTVTDQSGTFAGWFQNNTNGIWGSIGKGVSDFASFIEGTTNNARITIEGGVLYADSLKEWGYFANIYFPLSGTNNVLGAGFGAAYLNNDWYDATLNARLGSNIPLPYGLDHYIPLYGYIESGGGYNFQTRQGIAQAFTGATLHWPIARNRRGGTWDITIGGAVGTISDIKGNVKAAGGSLTIPLG